MKQNHTRVFFIETAFLTLFVLLALTVLVQVFGKARQLGEQAAHTSAAVSAASIMNISNIGLSRLRFFAFVFSMYITPPARQAANTARSAWPAQDSAACGSAYSMLKA